MSNATTETAALGFKRMSGPYPTWQAQGRNYGVTVVDGSSVRGVFSVTVECLSECITVGSFRRKTIGGAMRAAARVVKGDTNSNGRLDWLPSDFDWSEGWLLDYPKVG